MKILVTGCGRSGTQWITQVLQKLGLRGGHEAIYTTEWKRIKGGFAPDYSADWRDRDFEVSWLAAPFLEYRPENIVVWHQLRNPLKMLRCWESHDLLTNPKRPVFQFLASLTGQRILRLYDDPDTKETRRLRAVRYIYYWNDTIRSKKPWITYQIETLTPEKLKHMIVASTGLSIPLSEIEAVMASVPTNVGTCNLQKPGELHSESPPTWEEIHTTYEGDELLEQAIACGYAAR